MGIFCIPIVLFKVHLDHRNKEHAKYFPLLPQEEESTRNVNILFETSMAYFLLLLPIIQIGLGWAYFKFGHPWKRIMQNLNGEEDDTIEMDNIVCHDQENCLAHEETPEPLTCGDVGGQDHESLKEEHQEKNSLQEQGTETPMS